MLHRKQKLFNGVPFDRQKIRSKITLFSLDKAFRLRGPIYDRIVSELQIAGCPIAARHFRCLADHEQTLFENGHIRDRVLDSYELVEKLFENTRSAEQAVKFTKCNATYALMFKLLNANIKLLENYGNLYDWLLEEVYDIISKIAARIDTKYSEYNEELALFFFKYALYLKRRDESNVYSVIYYMEKSMKMCKTSLWLADESFNETAGPFNYGETFHQVVGRKLATLFLDFTMRVLRHDEVLAVTMNENALRVISEVGHTKNKVLYYRCILTNAKIQMHKNNFILALKIMDKVHIYDETDDDIEFLKMLWEYLLTSAECYMNLEQLSLSKDYLYRSLSLSQKMSVSKCEAKTLQQLGKLYGHKLGLIDRGIEFLQKGREIFKEIKDYHNMRKNVFFLAQFKAQKLKHIIFKNIKVSESNFCTMFKLRKWKNQCRPFWVDRININYAPYVYTHVEGEEGEYNESSTEDSHYLEFESDPIHCLLHEFDSTVDLEDEQPDEELHSSSSHADLNMIK